MFGVFAARAVMLLGVLAAFIFFGVWLNGNALGAIFADAERTPKASQLALHLMVILNRSLLAFGDPPVATMTVPVAVFQVMRGRLPVGLV